MRWYTQTPKSLWYFIVPFFGFVIWFVLKGAFLGAFVVSVCMGLVVVTGLTLHRPRKFAALYIFLLVLALTVPFLMDTRVRYFVGILLVIALLPNVNRLRVRRQLLNLHSVSIALILMMLALLPFEEVCYPLQPFRISVNEVRWLGLVIFPFSVLTMTLTSRFLSSQFLGLERSRRDFAWLRTFFNLVSHHIRTPLTSVQSTSDVLRLKLEGPDSSDNEALLSLVKRIQDSAEEGTLVVDKLLSVIQRTYQFQQLGNQELVQGLTQAHTDLEFEVYSEQARYLESEFVSILLSLEVFVRNARQHSEGTIRVELGERYLHVYDNGEGKSKEKMQAYTKRVSERDDQVKISGVGIYFAKQLLEQVGMHAYPNRVKDRFRMTIDTERTQVTADTDFSRMIGNKLA